MNLWLILHNFPVPGDICRHTCRFHENCYDIISHYKRVNKSATVDDYFFPIYPDYSYCPIPFLEKEYVEDLLKEIIYRCQKR